MNNPYSLPGDPNLPPGVTPQMIDEHMGIEPDESQRCHSCQSAFAVRFGLCRECYAEGKAEYYADREQSGEYTD